MLAISLAGDLLGGRLALVASTLLLSATAFFLFGLPGPLDGLDLVSDSLRHVKLRLLGRQLLKDLQVLGLLLVGVLNKRIKLAFLTLGLNLKKDQQQLIIKDKDVRGIFGCDSR